MRMFLALLGLVCLALPAWAGGYPSAQFQRAPVYAPQGVCAPQAAFAPAYAAPVQVFRQPVYAPQAAFVPAYAPAFVPAYGVGVGAGFQRTEIRQRRGFLGRSRSRSVQQFRIGF